jgi:hypothetical protein
MRPSDVVEHDFLRTRVRFVDDSTTNDQLFTCSLSRTLFMTEILLNTNIVLIPDDIHGTLMVSMLVYSLVSQRSVIQTDDNKQQVLISTSAFKNNPTPTPVPIPPDNNDTGNSSLPIYFGVGGGAILFFGVIIVSIHSYRKHLL